MKVAQTQASIVDVADSNTPTIVSKAWLARGEPEYRRRIEGLRGMAKDEGVAISEDSINDFWQLIGTLTPTQEGELSITDEGNLTANWYDTGGNNIGIQLLGGGVLQYVILKGQRLSEGRICEADRGGIPYLKERVEKYDLKELMGI